jgi:hypothetical protein
MLSRLAAENISIPAWPIHDVYDWEWVLHLVAIAFKKNRNIYRDQQ